MKKILFLIAEIIFCILIAFGTLEIIKKIDKGFAISRDATIILLICVASSFAILNRLEFKKRILADIVSTIIITVLVGYLLKMFSIF